MRKTSHRRKRPHGSKAKAKWPPAEFTLPSEEELERLSQPAPDNLIRNQTAPHLEPEENGTPAASVAKTVAEIVRKPT